MPGDELVVAARVAQDLAPAAQEFATAIGRSGPVQEFVQWITEEIRYRREPHKARLLMATAVKVRATGIPPRAVEDRLLRVVLEEGALEDDTDMQDRWANLLANAAVGDRVPHVAFPGLLAQISPVEARMLDAMYRTLDAEFSGDANSIHRFDGFPPRFFEEKAQVALRQYPTAAKNLIRVGLADETGVHMGPAIWHGDSHTIVSRSIGMSYFGAEFVVACSSPGSFRAITELRISEE